MKKLAIVTLAAFAALAACKKDDAANGDSTAVATDTTMTAPAPAAAPMATDTTMAAPATTDTTAATTDTTAHDTTKKM
jgi:hypothetical protein